VASLLKDQTISSAYIFLNRLDFESMTDCLLSFLHQRPSPEIPAGLTSLINDNLGIIIPCGGLSSRWNAAFLPRKHRLDLGDRVPLIETTIQQLSRIFPRSQCSIIESNSFCPVVSGDCRNLCELIPLTFKQSDPAAIEILHNSLHLSSHSGKSLLWLYGDVSFTWESLQAIASRISQNPDSLCFFGRKNANKAFANSGGEIFGAYVPAAMKERLLQIYRFIEKLAIGMPLPRVSTWEAVSYLSILEQNLTSQLPLPSLIQEDAQLTVRLMGAAYSERCFKSSIWLEIDDQTEDFDYPFEYIRRLYWLALR